MTCMESTKYIYWQDKDQWLGYLQDYPDYWTQGQSLEELESHLCDLYRDLTSGEIPGVRKLAELKPVAACWFATAGSTIGIITPPRRSPNLFHVTPKSTSISRTAS
jgi:hypothetical protein